MVFGGGEAHLVLNPSAGKGRAGGLRASVSRFFEERGLRPVWHVTEGPGRAVSIVRRLPEEISVVAVGGDGTVHEVAAACAGTGRTMGVLPAGSGNDYVKALGVGTGLRRALEVLVTGKVRVVDTAEVNGVPFNNGLGIGFDAEVAAGVARAPAQRLSRPLRDSSGKAEKRQGEARVATPLVEVRAAAPSAIVPPRQ